ncbi:uncharacterized protein GGS22DRAFT_195196 [Annulohypoxylon maeteangense]|uniref:uncharacterized protein n=1 Tax=Annulohypoxylon maeteangense TaxID=1927788 RepID=UPI0020085408|nr:uncharacterized protein GGS22DRAFT_195196 [Annulohypoxylon maeteangense]KAI0883451.1 hypothetical protein GGS22DRAFT_195196 [Annulohypoxylon maeteangense]
MNAAQASFPDGLSTMSLYINELIFICALNFIKGNLSKEFLKEKWTDSLVDAIEASSVSPENTINVQLLQPLYSKEHSTRYIGQSPNHVGQFVSHSGYCSWFSIKLLNVLWDMLFGRTHGSSPWQDVIRFVEPHVNNGTAADMAYLNAIHRKMIRDPMNAEKIILTYLGKFFPMEIAIPKLITLAPEADT